MLCTMFLCSICDKACSTKGNLKKHINIHSKTRQPTGYDFKVALFKCLEGCEISFKTNKDLRQHLLIAHEVEILEIYLDFSTFQEFKMWLREEEESHGVKFFKTRGVKRKEERNCEIIYLDCKKTGKQRLIAEEKRKRGKRRISSCKSNYGCTSQIIATKEMTSEKCSVLYYLQHYGHDKIEQCKKAVGS